MTACAGSRPARTCSCTAGGISRTRPRCLDTQLGLRPSRVASSSPLSPWRSLSSRKSHPLSSALSLADWRWPRSAKSASASETGHTIADTVSRPSRRRARRRRCPSITTYRPGSSASATTTIGTCWPLSDSDPSSRRSASARRTRRGS